jgi:DNA-binding transcriptional ArsR family regulator
MARDLDPIWKALADASRRTILDDLRDGPKRTGDLCESFDSTRFAVMKHLRVLERAGLIVVRRRGRERWNYLNPVPIQQIVERWITPYASMWARDLLDLKKTVERREAIKNARRAGDSRETGTRV